MSVDETTVVDETGGGTTMANETGGDTTVVDEAEGDMAVIDEAEGDMAVIDEAGGDTTVVDEAEGDTTTVVDEAEGDTTTVVDETGGTDEVMTEQQKILKGTMTHLYQNSMLYLAPSDLHGVGVHASTNVNTGVTTWIPSPPCIRLDNPQAMEKHIPPGTRARLTSMFRIPGVIPKYGLHLVGLTSFLNHRNKPNAILRDDGAIRFTHDIRAGEEITIDYRSTSGWETLLPASKADRRGRGRRRPRG